MLAETAVNVVNPQVVVPAPKQTKLLGATIKGVGVIVCVSQSLKWGYAIIEDASGKSHYAFLADLKKDQLEFPPELQPYRLCTMRAGRVRAVGRCLFLIDARSDGSEDGCMSGRKPLPLTGDCEGCGRPDGVAQPHFDSVYCPRCAAKQDDYDRARSHLSTLIEPAVAAWRRH